MDYILVLDIMSVSFVMLVTYIASSVMIYAQEYMDSDLNKNRLSGLLLLFIFSMLLFIITPNMITMLLGWDGLGIISYVLVLFYNNHSSAGAAMITALTNRIGDILIIISIGLNLKVGHWGLNTFENLSADMIYLLLLIAACTKSAQFPFCAWLPQAMAAPTPVSALVHSSTLVTAGVYLMVRLSHSMLPSQSWLNLIALLATITSVMAGLSALVETDLKKIVALSTLSQLGTMVLALSLGYPNLAFFHLMTHAVSKSLLFISVGAFISSNMGGQDTRNLNSQLWVSVPFSFMGAFLASLSLCGIPFISGFYSKDLILESLWQLPESSFTVIGGVLSTALTSAYSIKLLLMSFTQVPSNESLPSRLVNVPESYFVKAPIFFLSAMTLYLGYFLSKSGTVFFTPLLLSESHKILTPLSLVLGWVLVTAEKQGYISKLSTGSHHFFNSMFFLETITAQAVLLNANKPLHLPYKAMDRGWIETVSVKASESIVFHLLKMDTHMSNQPILAYTVYAALAFIMFIFLMSPSEMLFS
nr:NADH dehydrogenase subunit 5 [Nipponacmea sp. JM-2022]